MRFRSAPARTTKTTWNAQSSPIDFLPATGENLSPTSSPISAAQRALDTEPQSIDAPLSAAAAFLILVIKDDDASIATARSVVGGTDDLVKNVRIRTDGGVF